MNPPIAQLARKIEIKGCCDDFNHHINRKCDDHGFECPDHPIRLYTNAEWNPEFGIPLPHKDGISHIRISNCPWCGKPLQPIACDAVDGFVKYTVVFNDAFGGMLVGIVNNLVVVVRKDVTTPIHLKILGLLYLNNQNNQLNILNAKRIQCLEEKSLNNMPISHKKEYGIYHWDTFDNETFQVGEEDTLEKARAFVMERYKGRISGHGADRVDIVDQSGNIVEQYSVG